MKSIYGTFGTDLTEMSENELLFCFGVLVYYRDTKQRERER